MGHPLKKATLNPNELTEDEKEEVRQFMEQFRAENRVLETRRRRIQWHE